MTKVKRRKRDAEKEANSGDDSDDKYVPYVPLSKRRAIEQERLNLLKKERGINKRKVAEMLKKEVNCAPVASQRQHSQPLRLSRGVG